MYYTTHATPRWEIHFQQYSKKFQCSKEDVVTAIANLCH